MRTKKSAINKKINSQTKKPHLKMIPIKDNHKSWARHCWRSMDELLNDVLSDEQVLDDQLELIYNSSVQTQDVGKKNGRKCWTIETNSERELRKSVLAALQNEEDDYRPVTDRKLRLEHKYYWKWNFDNIRGRS